MNAELIEKKVILNDEKLSSALYNKSSFGALVNNKLELSLTEALYLIEKEKIIVYDNKKQLTYDSFLKKASRLDKKFMEKYKVYRDLRNRGFITKTALKYGADFRVYEKGSRPGDEHATFTVLSVGEHDPFSWQEFSAMVRVAHTIRKGLLIAVVDDEGDVTYYSCSWQRL
ncbi:tRNA-splicing endonuclease [Candidatus Tiddalikarchaeum anstoanum]|nr:tRNA-splicing endonuclease [Candidatus Tiddalikarchaeum anstoanum]